jgi:hypothetical protein
MDAASAPRGKVGEGRPVSATPHRFATRKYADAVLRRADFDAKERSIFIVIPGRIADANPESRDSGSGLRTIPE